MKFIAWIKGDLHAVSENREKVERHTGNRAAPVHEDSVRGYRGRFEIIDLDEKPGRVKIGGVTWKNPNG